MDGFLSQFSPGIQIIVGFLLFLTPCFIIVYIKQKIQAYQSGEHKNRNIDKIRQELDEEEVEAKRFWELMEENMGGIENVRNWLKQCREFEKTNYKEYCEVMKKELKLDDKGWDKIYQRIMKKTWEEQEIEEQKLIIPTRQTIIVEDDDYDRNNDIDREFYKKYKLKLIEEFDCKCAICRSNDNGVDIDHYYIPKKSGGNFILKGLDGRQILNAVPLCEFCNRSKGSTKGNYDMKIVKKLHELQHKWFGTPLISDKSKKLTQKDTEFNELIQEAKELNKYLSQKQ